MLVICQAFFTSRTPEILQRTWTGSPAAAAARELVTKSADTNHRINDKLSLFWTTPSRFTTNSHQIPMQSTARTLIVRYQFIFVALALSIAPGTTRGQAPAVPVVDAGKAEPLSWTTQQDHQNMMEQLGIKTSAARAERSPGRAELSQLRSREGQSVSRSARSAHAEERARRSPPPRCGGNSGGRKSSRTSSAKSSGACRRTCPKVTWTVTSSVTNGVVGESPGEWRNNSSATWTTPPSRPSPWTSR